MNIREFREAIAETLTNKLGQEYEVVQQDVSKINHLELLGISIHRKNENICPVIYVEKYFEQYNNGARIQDLADEIMAVLEDNQVPSIPVNEIRFIQDWDYAKANVSCKLINREANKDYLADIPHTEFLNLSVIYYVECGYLIGANRGTASVTITNEILDCYGITIEELHQQAMENMASISIRPLTSVLFDLLNENDMDCDEFAGITPEDDPGLYVMTNQRKVFGAVGIVNDTVRKKITEQFGGADMYILPSSIHELLLLRASENCDPQDLLAMVDGVNSTEVADEDILATNVYLLHGDTGEVEIAA